MPEAFAALLLWLGVWCLLLACAGWIVRLLMRRRW